MTIERLPLADARAAIADGASPTPRRSSASCSPRAGPTDSRYPGVVRVGVPTETKTAEARVALTPDGVRELRHHGHEVAVESTAGEGSSITDDEYARRRGRDRHAPPTRGRAELVREGQGAADRRSTGSCAADLVLFTYLHLAAYPRRRRPHSSSAGTTGVAYETVQLADGALPLLAPMSEVAGRMATAGRRPLPRDARTAAAACSSAAHPVCARRGSSCSAPATSAGTRRGSPRAWRPRSLLLDRNLDRLRWVDQIHQGRIMTLASNRGAVERAVADADLRHRRRARRRAVERPIVVTEDDGRRRCAPAR